MQSRWPVDVADAPPTPSTPSGGRTHCARCRPWTASSPGGHGDEQRRDGPCTAASLPGLGVVLPTRPAAVTAQRGDGWGTTSITRLPPVIAVATIRQWRLPLATHCHVARQLAISVCLRPPTGNTAASRRRPSSDNTATSYCCCGCRTVKQARE